MSHVSEAFKKLLSLASKAGYLTENQIAEVTLQNNVPLTELDPLCRMLTERGVIVSDETQLNVNKESDEEVYDRSRTNYLVLYEKIVEQDPDLDFLVSEIRKILPPQHREFTSLIHQAQNGNEYARTRIVHMYMRNALRQAKFFSKRNNLELADTVQDALMGLVIALRKYKVGESSAFLTYSSSYMRQYITRNAPVNRSLVRLPDHINVHIRKYMAIRKEKKYADLTPAELYRKKDELMKTLEINEETFEVVFIYIFPMLSLEDIEDLIQRSNKQCERLILVEDKIAREQLNDSLMEIMDNSLDERSKEIICCRFGINKKKRYTLQELADRYEITRERVRQIEKQALRRLKGPCIKRGLEEFFYK